MYIVKVPNQTAKPAILLRESYRENGKVKNRTLANLTDWPGEVVDALRVVLKGGRAVRSMDDLFEIVESRHHGHVQAVLAAMKRLGFSDLISSRPSRERDLVLAMVIARVLDPDSKLATTRWWHTNTVAEAVGVADATEADLYAAMDWLQARQDVIERKLGARHLDEDSLALYDLSAAHFEGKCCPLAARGHPRGGKVGCTQVEFGLITNSAGCPVSVSVYPGNTGDPSTVMDQVNTIKKRFAINKLALVGDRGMITQTQIDAFKDANIEGLDWITALKSDKIQKLMDQDLIQLGLFDKQTFYEIAHPDFPAERLVACRNDDLARLRTHKRESLLASTVKELEQVQGMVKKGKLLGAGDIGVRVGRVVNKYKVAKHFALEIDDHNFSFKIRTEKVQEEAKLDGIYVIRTSLPAARLNTADTVRSYKLLSNVERAFRSLKGIDRKVRPIYHHLEGRVRAHIFLCMLAYYVEFHMREAWRELLFADEDQEAKKTRDPVSPAKRSKEALVKAHTHAYPLSPEACRGATKSPRRALHDKPGANPGSAGILPAPPFCACSARRRPAGRRRSQDAGLSGASG